ncbi:MAG: TraR/DksA C4-type zinc finger protein [Actinobacteria bacterium]|nr:TraR/DksA C4-type zinc finger protein [Actinomycetota bacterium]
MGGRRHRDGRRGPPRPARILASIDCVACGEPTMETRTRRLDGRELCHRASRTRCRERSVCLRRSVARAGFVEPLEWGGCWRHGEEGRPLRTLGTRAARARRWTARPSSGVTRVSGPDIPVLSIEEPPEPVEHGDRDRARVASFLPRGPSIPL